jgi:hypothetical protein
MDKHPSHRLQIWDLANHKLADPKKPVAPARPEKPDRPTRFERLARPDLLHNDLSASGRPSASIEDAATLTSLYDHRLPIDVELPGRATMPNGRSTTCKTKKISSESVDLVYDLQTTGYPLKAPEEIPAGSTVHLDLEQIGNFHGVVTSQNAEGFQLAVDVDCKGMLISKLAQVAAAIRNTTFEEAPLEAKRNVTRIEPTIKNCSYTDNMGMMRKGKIINISPYDALVKATVIPQISTFIIFGGPHARLAEVTRTFEIGFAVQFCAPIPDEDFSVAIKLLDE